MKKFASVLALLMTALAAIATPINTHVDTWLNDSALYGGAAAITTDGGSTWRGVLAGQFLAHAGEISWTTYCTDVNYHLADGFFNAGSPDVNVAHSPIWTGNYGLAESVYLDYRGDVNSNTKAVALQLAIWECLQDTDMNLLTGQFRAGEGAAEAQAQTWLNGIDGATCGIWWEPTDRNGNYRQNQGLLGEGCSVPDSGGCLALILVSFGLIAICARHFPVNIRQIA